MPPVARVLGLIVVLAVAADLTAQTPSGYAPRAPLPDGDELARAWVSQASYEEPVDNGSDTGTATTADFRTMSPLPKSGPSPPGTSRDRGNQPGASPSHVPRLPEPAQRPAGTSGSIRLSPRHDGASQASGGLGPTRASSPW